MATEFSFENFSVTSLKLYLENGPREEVHSRLKDILFFIKKLNSDEITPIINKVGTKINSLLIVEYNLLKNDFSKNINDVICNLGNKPDKYNLWFHIIKGALQYQNDSNFFTTAVNSIEKSQTLKGEKGGGGGKNVDEINNEQLKVLQAGVGELKEILNKISGTLESNLTTNQSISAMNNGQETFLQVDVEKFKEILDEMSRSLVIKLNQNQSISDLIDLKTNVFEVSVTELKESFVAVSVSLKTISKTEGPSNSIAEISYYLVFGIAAVSLLTFIYILIGFGSSTIGKINKQEEIFAKVLNSKVISENPDSEDQKDKAQSLANILNEILKKTVQLENNTKNIPATDKNKGSPAIVFDGKQISDMASIIAKEVKKNPIEVNDTLTKNDFAIELQKKFQEVSVKTNTEKDNEFKDFKDKLIDAMKSKSPKVDENKGGQLKGIEPSRKVTAEDKNDIAKLTSDPIIKFIKEEIIKNLPTNNTSKDKNNELALKEKEKQFTDLLFNQEKLKNDLETQKNLVISKDKELLEVNKTKTGFKGTPGSYAILLTNSKDFELTEPILSATLVAVEKQNKESNGLQKLGIYVATGNSIDVKFSLKKGTRGLKPTEMDVANARPTETIAEVGKTFLEFAFDDGKEPIIPVNERKAIIIATWSAGAPKDLDGWDKVSQIDAILIQTPKANQLREGSAWLDFILKKNGRLLFIQAEEKITGSSSAISQLQKHLSTLLNTKKE